MQKYIPNSYGLYFNYAFNKLNNEGLLYGFEFGPNMSIPTKKVYASTQFFFHYGIYAGYKVNKLTVNIEFLGLLIATGQTQNLSDRLINFLNFGAQWKETVIRPKIFYKIYLREEMKNIIDGVLGLGVDVSID